jgi:hypothetical protein
MARWPQKLMKAALERSRDREGVNMALRAAESDEDVRLPAPNRDREGVYMALRAAESDEDALSDERGINNLGRVFNGADVFNRVDLLSELIGKPVSGLRFLSKRPAKRRADLPKVRREGAG